MTGWAAAPAIAFLALVGGLSLTPAAAGSSPAALPTPAYFSIVPGAVTETTSSGSTNFAVAEFVLAEPAGLPANFTLTTQIWQTLQVAYVGNATPLDSWSVSSVSSGRFVLALNLSDDQVVQIESGDAMLSLTGEAVIGNAAVGAAGTIGAATLASAHVPENFWEEWFGIPAPPGFNSPENVIVTLAALNDSVAGRALYMAVTIIAATVYLYSAHKITRDRLSGTDKATESRKRAQGATG